MADAPAPLPSRAAREVQYVGEVQANLRRNIIANFIHGMLGMTGFRIVYAPTLIPAYLQLISGSAFIVGVGQSLLQVGICLSPLASAAALEHRKRILPIAVRFGTLMRVAVLGIAIAGYLLGGVTLVVATLVCLAALGIFNGMQRVAFQMLISKLIPIDRRGLLQGARNLVGGAIAAVLSYIAGKWLIDGNVWGNGYATTFLFAFVLTSLGLVALQYGVVEPDAPAVRRQVSVRERMRDIPALLEDRDYRWFMIAQGLAMAGKIAAPFYILIATTEGGAMTLDGTTVGLLSLAFLGADTVSNLGWGIMGDRLGYRITFLASLAFTLAGIGCLEFATGPALTIAAFAAFGVGGAGYGLSATTMVLEFGVSEDLPMRIALSTMFEGAVSAITPIIGGLMLLWATSDLLLGTAAIITFAAILVFAVLVRDPRRRAAPVWED